MRGDDAYAILKKKMQDMQGEKIQESVNRYFDEHPVQAGATAEQVQQIEQNKKDVDSLKEDISTKITKFYASSQGETHLADSDNGKIQDMMIYGKSEQKQYSGKNLLNPILQTTTQNGITCTANGDGTFTLNGTATANTAFILSGDILSLFVPNKKLKMIGTPKGGSSNSYRIQMWRQLDVPGELYDYGDGVEILAPTGNYNIAIWITNKFVCNNLIFKPMIVDASLYPDATYDDFEPYTGGIPSPNPDYPQEIKSVVNPKVVVMGKNLLNTNNIVVGKWLYQVNGTEVIDDSTQYYPDYISMHGEKSCMISYKSGRLFWCSITAYDNDKKVIASEGVQVNNTDNIVHTFRKNVAYIRISSTRGIEGEIQVEYGTKKSSYVPYQPEQSVMLPYTLNAIPVSSGGNVTIDGQQYMSDRVVEKDGVFGIERNIREIHTNTKTMNNDEEYPGWNKVEGISDTTYHSETSTGEARKLFSASNFTNITLFQNNNETINILYYIKNDIGYSQSELIARAIDVDMYVRLQDAIFEPLPGDIQVKLQTFVTNYPVTNISVTSDQLDGYTVFNYPISMANGWNYVKQQLNDNRDYIYDMDTQSAEAYVNSEYAVTLTELEV